MTTTIEPSGGDEITRCQTRPPAAPAHDFGCWQCQQSSADYRGARRKTRNTDACELGRKQRFDGRTDPHANAADDLCCEEHAQGTTLNRDQIERCDGCFGS